MDSCAPQEGNVQERGEEAEWWVSNRNVPPSNCGNKRNYSPSEQRLMSSCTRIRTGSQDETDFPNLNYWNKIMFERISRPSLLHPPTGSTEKQKRNLDIYRLDQEREGVLDLWTDSRHSYQVIFCWVNSPILSLSLSLYYHANTINLWNVILPVKVGEWSSPLTFSTDFSVPGTEWRPERPSTAIQPRKVLTAGFMAFSLAHFMVPLTDVHIVTQWTGYFLCICSLGICNLINRSRKSTVHAPGGNVFPVDFTFIRKNSLTCA